MREEIDRAWERLREMGRELETNSRTKTGKSSLRGRGGGRGYTSAPSEQDVLRAFKGELAAEHSVEDHSARPHVRHPPVITGPLVRQHLCRAPRGIYRDGGKGDFWGAVLVASSLVPRAPCVWRAGWCWDSRPGKARGA